MTSLLLFTLPVYAQVEMQRPYADTAPRFHFEILNFKSETNQSRLDFYFQIPYNRLHFVKSENEFTSTFYISLRLVDKNGEATFEESREEKAVCKAFDETVSEAILFSSQRHFTVAPGTYTLYVTVTEQEVEGSFTEKERVVARDYSTGQASMSDIMILASMSRSGGKQVIVPNVDRNVVSQQDSFPVFYEIYAPHNDSIYVMTEIFGKKDDVLYSASRRLFRSDSMEEVFAEIPKDSLTMGRYRLSVSLRSGDGTSSPVVAAASCEFSIRLPQLPPSITDLDKAAEEMMFIASSSTIDSIKSAPDAATKLRRFMSFWQDYHSNFSHDSRTSMEEYYNRVAYANKQFAHFFEGWKSDRGMVYILFGPPDNVGRYPFNLDTKPYEIWHYYMKARHFLFVDDTGFGDYRLRNPIWANNSPLSGMDFLRK